ncbi:MAG: type 2 isopentenyl-diphosphate Delta-isomerase [Gammaproteobacteria bacterium]|nr:type 2 isopentenyl-diphosphate Delta-isomerase [Gammaproteobacteria bacterium]
MSARSPVDDAQETVAAPHRDPAAKRQHLDVCLYEDVEYRKSTGLEVWTFQNDALPEVSLEHLDLSGSLVGRRLGAPLMISPMTGGTRRAGELNLRLARVAQRFGLAMGVGSQRLALEDAARARWFRVRHVAPDIALFANFGGAQLVRGWGVDEARRAVEMIEADALFIHLNPIQEAIQGGDQDFRGLARRLEALCTALRADGIPVFAREVGFGLSENAARRLIECGVAGLDCAGAGGTSWARVEALCARSERRRILGERFAEWGIPTSQSILNVRRVTADIPLIACGGLRDGMDVARALALGADVGSMARPMLLRAHESEAALAAFVDSVLTELRVCMFGSGAANVKALRGRVFRAEPAS